MCDCRNSHGSNSRAWKGLSRDDILFYLDDVSLLSDCLLGVGHSWVGFQLGSSGLRRQAVRFSLQYY